MTAVKQPFQISDILCVMTILVSQLASVPYRIINKEIIGPQHALYVIEGRVD